MGVGQILIDFSGWTSAHGIPHIGSAQNVCMRIFWAVIFIGSTSMFIFQMTLLVQKFLAYDVTVQTELKFEERSFPAVTVCNLNPYRNQTLLKVPVMADLMHDYKASIDDRSQLGIGDPWNFSTIFANDSIALQSKARDHLMFVARYYEKNNSTLLREEVTYSLGDFIMNCAYNTKPCVMNSDFKKELDPIYGNCFTFNHASKYKSTRAGPLYGLRILAKSVQADYLALTESAGIRVAVHGQAEESFPDAFGYNAAAGFTTSFGIKFIQTERLPSPYGNCTKTDHKGAYYYQGDYSVEGCFRSCFQENVVKKCGCGDPRFKIEKGKDYCSYSNGKQRACVDSFAASSGVSSFNAIEECACPQPCTESTYGVTVSTALWPSDVYTPPDCTTGGQNIEDCTKWYSENTMLIEIYYERMNYQMLSESPAYTLVNLISDMGGQLGLWMGISVITVVEFLSLMIILILFCCTRNRAKKNQEKQETEMGDQEETPSPETTKVDPYGVESDSGSDGMPPTPVSA